MPRELISIIMPLYNKEKYIEETMKSIIKQTYTNWELIIIDDKSTDNSAKICNKYLNEKIKLVSMSENSGPALARNKGIELAKGRYIAFVDADDLWKEEKLEKQIEFMEENNYSFTYSQFQYINENGNAKNNKTEVQTKTTYKEALKNIRILTSTVIIDLKQINKELIKMPNVVSEDIATWWQILKNGHIAYGLQECLVGYRVTKDSLSGNKIKSVINRWKLYIQYEKLSLVKSIYYFTHYIFNAIIKRIK